jgi:hypothetical protein
MNHPTRMRDASLCQRYVDAQRVNMGLQLLSVCVVRPHAELGFSSPQVVQVLGTYYGLLFLVVLLSGNITRAVL